MTGRDLNFMDFVNRVSLIVIREMRTPMDVLVFSCVMVATSLATVIALQWVLPAPLWIIVISGILAVVAMTALVVNGLRLRSEAARKEQKTLNDLKG